MKKLIKEFQEMIEDPDFGIYFAVVFCGGFSLIVFAIYRFIEAFL